jgi:hypothetical protein
LWRRLWRKGTRPDEALEKEAECLHFSEVTSARYETFLWEREQIAKINKKGRCIFPFDV